MTAKLFVLNRLEDETGISGTGIVAEGVIFSNGKCAVSWLTKVTSVAVYDSIEEVKAIHGHDGKTVIEYAPAFKVVERRDPHLLAEEEFDERDKPVVITYEDLTEGLDD